MSRERHYNKTWSSSSSRNRSRSPYWRRRSRSPIRDKYSNRNRFRNDRREDARNELQRREEILRSEQEEALRREMKIREEQLEIQLREDARQRELKRREEELEIQMRVEEREEEIKKIEEQIEQQMREEEIKKKEMKKREEDEKKRKEAEEQKNAVAEDDLRFMLEKSRTFQSLTPPVAAPSSNTAQTEIAPSGNVKITPTSGPETISKTPGFDYSRLGGEPSNDAEKITRSVSSSVDENRDKSCEGRVNYFTKDCDTVAVVTQLLIDQDPTLEDALVKAMHGVLQKVMQKHLEVIQL